MENKKMELLVNMEKKKKKKSEDQERKLEKEEEKEEDEDEEAAEEEDVVLPGFRFHPTDEELVGFYLRRKVDNKPISIEVIKQIDIYKYDPWDLPKVSNVGDKEWYFFCLRGRKYRNSIRPNRVTGSGFWKATGIDRPIYSPNDNGECIGLKKSLVYYRGSAGKGTKTDWMMHEFRLPPATKNDANNPPSLQEAEIWTICRIFKRNTTYKRYHPQDWSTKGSPRKQILASDASSKTNSFESDTGEDQFKCFGISYADHQGHDNKIPTTNNYFDQRNHFYTTQWNQMTTQAPLTTTLHSSTLNPNELIKETNWDELGRMTEFMTDPAFVYDGRYSSVTYNSM